MKKIIIIITFILFGIFIVNSQTILSTTYNINNYWAQWQNRGSLSYGRYRCSILHYADNNFVGLKFWTSYNSSNEWCFVFGINNYIKPDKKSIKYHYKNKIWYEYSGWVEYYVSDDYPTIEKVLQENGFPFLSHTGNSARANRRAYATIRIAPFKKEPTTFNIYFDDVGIGISLSNWPFSKYYVIK